VAQAGSLKPFYLTLGALAVVGAGLIAWQAMGRGSPARPSLQRLPGLPIAAGPRGVVFGADSAPVEITEFADFECPWCARYAVLTLPDIKSRLVAAGRVRLRFVHFPLDIHPNSPSAHLAAACANEQGRFWPMHDQIYDSQAEWVASRRPDRPLRESAQRAGLDLGRYDACMRDQSAWPQVLSDKALGDSAGVNGTPTFLVNGTMLTEDPPTFTRWVVIVDSVIAAQGVAAPGTGPARRPRG
jgi:protein-disulfide isomerase